MEPVEIVAEHIAWEAGVATATGGVRITWGDQVLTGRSATVSPTEATVEDGVLVRPDGALTFEAATVRFADGQATLRTVSATTGDATIEADTVSATEGRWVLGGAALSPCRCDDGGPAALTFSAGDLEVRPGDVAIVRGGAARLFGVPVLPVPYARIPLDEDRLRLDVPQVGHGDFGWFAEAKARGGVGAWDLAGGPAWREDRGFRGEVSAAGPVGDRPGEGANARGELGWDALAEEVRGVGTTRGGRDRVARVAWDATVASDPTYADDQGVDYVTRGVGWRESRAVFGMGPLRVDGWLPDDGSEGTLAQARGRVEVGLGGGAPRVGSGVSAPLVVAPRLALATVGDLDGVAPIGEAGLELRGSGTAGPVVARVAGDAAVAGWAGWEAGAMGAAQVEVPVWTETPGGRKVQWWPGVRADAGWADASGVARLGPSLRAQAAWGEVGVGAEGRVAWDGAGWVPDGAIDVSGGAFGLRAQGDREVQAAEARWSPAPLSFGLGGAHADELWLSWGDVTARPGRLLVGTGLAWDLGAGAFTGADARLGYDDGCLAATLFARFAPDRALPDLGASLSFRPRRP